MPRCRLPGRRARPLGAALLIAAAAPPAAPETGLPREPSRGPTEIVVTNSGDPPSAAARAQPRPSSRPQPRPSAAAATPGPFDGPSPWPAIRRARIARLLPPAMREAGVDAWVVLLRENANDPLAPHVGGENAGAPSAVLLFRVAGAFVLPALAAAVASLVRGAPPG